MNTLRQCPHVRYCSCQSAAGFALGACKCTPLPRACSVVKSGKSRFQRRIVTPSGIDWQLELNWNAVRRVANWSSAINAKIQTL